MSVREITIAHSPDSDDAFMFYALATHKLKSEDFKFCHVLSDIETLNKNALNGEYEVTAVSFHAYPYLADKYLLLNSGASMGDRYGPMVVSNSPMKSRELKGKVVAIPGTMTTAFLALRLFEPKFTPVVVPFDHIFEAVKKGKAEAGLIIHEGQLTYAKEGLHKVIDLGEWWHKGTGLPLPLGGNVIRRDLGREMIAKISQLIRRSIQYALDNREEALNYAMQFARDLELDMADKFVGMYVNQRTLEYGPKEREAVQLLLDMGYQKKIIDRQIEVEFAD
jgi:1,4-dihydroxy-6-naphthoate synthase